jgi:hypothetical protein
VAGEPFHRTGVVGDAVTLRSATITLEQVRLSRSIMPTDQQKATTKGVWVVLSLGFAPRLPDLVMARPSIVTPDGRRFGDGQSVRTMCGPQQPGFTLECDMVLEVTEDALVGSRLEIPADPSISGVADDLADFDLGITQQKASELLTETAPIALREPALKGTR